MKKIEKQILSLIAAGTIVVGAPSVARASDDNTEPIFAVDTYDGISTYTVEKGDTLAKIALRFYGSSSLYKELAIYNNIENPDMIYKGQVIRLPRDLSVVYNYEDNTVVVDTPVVEYAPDNTYTVRCGDNLEVIALSFYGVKDRCLVDRIATYNGLSDPNQIVVGQTLLLPAYEKLMNVMPNDYTDEYNAMAKKLSELRKCREWYKKHHCGVPIIMPGTCIPVFPVEEPCPSLTLTPRCD